MGTEYENMFGDGDSLDEQKEADADAQYERWRDDEGNRLEEVLTDTFNMFVNNKNSGYYKGCPEKFIEHTIETLTSMTNTHLVMIGNIPSVVVNKKIARGSICKK